MIDTSDRRITIRTSPEVAAAKHLARTYGFSMRRRRRVGPVVFEIGYGAGELVFTDDGRLESAYLFGTHHIDASFPDLAGVLEYGPAHEESLDTTEITVLVLDELPDANAPLTGPIQLPDLSTALAVVTPEVVIPIAPVPVVRRRRIYSVPVRVVLTLPPAPKTLRDYQQEVLEEQPTARSLWSRFSVGMALLMQSLVLVFAPASGLQVRDSVAMFSVIIAVIGLALVKSAVTDNDQRLDALREVGLR